MSSLVLTIRETLRYRGAIGQWSWVLHRLTGLGVVLFLVLHVIDTSWSVFYPELYEEAIATYQTPLFTIGEFALVFAVVYHALNGLRIAIFDFKPEWWEHQKQAAYYVLIGTVVILVPVFIGMLGHVFDHYGEPGVEVKALGDVLVEQIPFLAGMVIAGLVAIVLSFIVGMATGENNDEAVSAKNQGSAVEKFMWSFMRVSGILIIPLVFGHLAMMHVIQGVFDLTAAGSMVVGTDVINVSGSAVEFVAHRWNYLWNGIAIWKIYDVALLALVTVHGFNGLRYVLTDYTMGNPMLRRAMAYLTIIGALVLFWTGGRALLYTIEPSFYEAAEEAARAFLLGS